MAIVEVAGRKPLEIRRIQYSFLHFESEGRIDPAQREGEARLAMEMLPPQAEEEERPHVVDARYRFAKKRFDDEYKWTPTPEIEAAIVEAIFGKERP
jgi:hypothetical protein